MGTSKRTHHLEHLRQPDPSVGELTAALQQLGNDPSVDDLIDFAYRGMDGNFRPIQIESEMRRLLYILRYKRISTVLEIGTANGGTLFLLSRLASSTATIISVDLPHGNLSYSRQRGDLYRCLTMPEQSLHILRLDSHDPGTVCSVSDILAGGALDFLFVDGDHSYEGVKLDYEMYAPLVARDGLIAFHDVVPLKEPQSWCEVDRFWREVRERHPYSELVEDWKQGWAGIGLIAQL